MLAAAVGGGGRCRRGHYGVINFWTLTSNNSRVDNLYRAIFAKFFTPTTTIFVFFLTIKFKNTTRLIHT